MNMNSSSGYVKFGSLPTANIRHAPNSNSNYLGVWV
jgi:hypothetical protein